MLGHIKAMHEGLDIEARKIFNCNLCTQNFISQQNLLRHVSSVHFGERKNFKCEICGKDFVELAGLKRHKLNIHDGVKPFKCEYLLDGKQCTAAYHQNHELKRHVENVHMKHLKEVKIFNCEKCGKSYNALASLNHHIKVNHEGIKDHICKICGKAFGQKQKLTIHVETVHEGLKKHQCNHCHLAFGQKHELKRHIEKTHIEKTHKKLAPTPHYLI